MLDELFEKYFSEIIKENPAITEEIGTIFEGAVSKAVAEKFVEKETELVSSNETELKEFKENIVDKLDEYISISVKEFTEENKANIESDMKVKLAENTFAVVKTLFTEAGIEIPEDQKNIITDLENKVNTMTDKLNETVNSDIKAKKQIFDLEKNLRFVSLSNDLSESKKEKLQSLIDSISCENIEDFEKKVIILRESISDKLEDKKNNKDLLENKDNFDKTSDLDKYLP